MLWLVRDLAEEEKPFFLSLSILFYYYYYFEEWKNEWCSSSKEVADDPGTGVDVKVGSGSV